MNRYCIYFSPTGGTKAVMDVLAADLPQDCFIDLSLPDCDYSTYRFAKEDVCLIGVPSYGGRVPAIAVDRLRQMRADGALAILVTAFGNRAYDDTLLELKDIAKSCGFIPIAASGAVTEHSIMHQFGAGRPNDSDIVELRQFAGICDDLIKNRDSLQELQVPGNSQYREYTGSHFKPIVNENCTKCGLCAEKCPVAAIPKENPSVTDEHICMSCIRCVSICPSAARTLDAAALAGAIVKMEPVCGSRKENEFFSC